MTTVTISQDFEIVLPREICESLDLEPGQKIRVLEYKNRIELIPVQPITKMRGLLRDINTSVEREKDRL